MIALYLALLDRPEERASFEDIYNAYKGKMMAIAYGVLGNYHDCEEAVSQAFFAVAKSFGKIQTQTRDTPITSTERSLLLVSAITSRFPAYLPL